MAEEMLFVHSEQRGNDGGNLASHLLKLTVKLHRNWHHLIPMFNSALIILMSYSTQQKSLLLHLGVPDAVDKLSQVSRKAEGISKH